VKVTNVVCMQSAITAVILFCFFYSVENVAGLDLSGRELGVNPPEDMADPH